MRLLCGIEKPWVQRKEKAEKAELSEEAKEVKTHVFLSISAQAFQKLIEENGEAFTLPVGLSSQISPMSKKPDRALSFYFLRRILTF